MHTITGMQWPWEACSNWMSTCESQNVNHGLTTLGECYLVNRCFPPQCMHTAASSGLYSGNSMRHPSLVCHPWSLCARLVSTKVYLKIHTCRHTWSFARDVRPLFAIHHHFDDFRGHGRHKQAMCGYINGQRCTCECEATVQANHLTQRTLHCPWHSQLITKTI